MGRYVYRWMVSIIFISIVMLFIFYGANDKDEGSGIVKPQNITKTLKTPINPRSKKQQDSKSGQQPSGQAAGTELGANAEDEEILPEPSKPHEEKKTLGKSSSEGTDGEKKPSCTINGKPCDDPSALSNLMNKQGDTDSAGDILSCENAAKTSQEIFSKLDKELHAVFTPLPDNLRKAIEEGSIFNSSWQPDMFNTSAPPEPPAKEHSSTQNTPPASKGCDPTKDPKCAKSTAGQANDKLPKTPVELKKLWWQLADKCKSLRRKFSMSDFLPTGATQGDIQQLRNYILRGWVNPRFKGIAIDWGACEGVQCKSTDGSGNETTLDPTAATFDPVNFILFEQSGKCMVKQPGSTPGEATACTCFIEPAINGLRGLPLEGNYDEIPLSPEFANDAFSRRNKLKFYVDAGVPLGNKLVSEGVKFLKYTELVYQYFKDNPYEFAAPTQIESGYFESLNELVGIIVEWNAMLGIPMLEVPPPVGETKNSGCPSFSATRCDLDIENFIKDETKCISIPTVLDFARKHPAVLNTICNNYYRKLLCIKEAAEYGMSINKVIYEPWFNNECQFKTPSHILDPEDLVGSFVRGARQEGMNKTESDFVQSNILNVLYIHTAINQFRMCVKNVSEDILPLSEGAVQARQSHQITTPLKIFSGPFSLFINHHKRGTGASAGACQGNKCIPLDIFAANLVVAVKSVPGFSENTFFHELRKHIKEGEQGVCASGLTIYDIYGEPLQEDPNAFDQNSPAVINARCWDRLQSLLCLGEKDVVFKENDDLFPVPLVTKGICYKCDYPIGTDTENSASVVDDKVSSCNVGKINVNDLGGKTMVLMSPICKGKKMSLPANSTSPFGMLEVKQNSFLRIPEDTNSLLRRCYGNFRDIDSDSSPVQNEETIIKLGHAYLANMTSDIVANSLLDVGFNAVFNTLYSMKAELDFLRLYIETAARAGGQLFNIDYKKLAPYLPLILLSSFNPTKAKDIWQENINAIEALIDKCFDATNGDYICDERNKTTITELLKGGNSRPAVGIFSPELMACYFIYKIKGSLQGYSQCSYPVITNFLNKTGSISFSGDLGAAIQEKLNKNILCKRCGSNVTPFGVGQGQGTDNQCNNNHPDMPFDMLYLKWEVDKKKNFYYPLNFAVVGGDCNQPQYTYTPLGLIDMFRGSSGKSDDFDFKTFLKSIGGIVGLNLLSYSDAPNILGELSKTIGTKEEVVQELQRKVIAEFQEVMEYLETFGGGDQNNPYLGYLTSQKNKILGKLSGGINDAFNELVSTLKGIQLYPHSFCEGLFKTKVSALMGFQKVYFVFVVTSDSSYALPYYVRQEFYGCMGSYLEQFIGNGNSTDLSHLAAAYLPVLSITSPSSPEKTALTGGFDKLMIIMKDYILRFAGIYESPYVTEGNMLIRTLPDMVKFLSTLTESVADAVTANSKIFGDEYLGGYRKGFPDFLNKTVQSVLSTPVNGSTGLGEDVKMLFLSLSLVQPVAESEQNVTYVFHKHLFSGEKSGGVTPIFLVKPDAIKDNMCFKAEGVGELTINKIADYLSEKKYLRPVSVSGCGCFTEDFSCFTAGVSLHSSFPQNNDNDEKNNTATFIKDSMTTFKETQIVSGSSQIIPNFLTYMLITMFTAKIDPVDTSKKGSLEVSTLECAFSYRLFVNFLADSVGDYTAVNDKCNTINGDSGILGFWSKVYNNFMSKMQGKIGYLISPEKIFNVSDPKKAGEEMRGKMFENIFSPKSWGGIFLCGDEKGGGGGKMKARASDGDFGIKSGLCP